MEKGREKRFVTQDHPSSIPLLEFILLLLPNEVERMETQRMRITRQREGEKEEREEKEDERGEGGDEGEGTLWAVIPIFTMSQKGTKFLVMEFLVRRSRT